MKTNNNNNSFIFEHFLDMSKHYIGLTNYLFSAVYEQIKGKTDVKLNFFAPQCTILI